MLIVMRFVLCLHTEDRARLPRMLKMQDFTTLHEGEFSAGATGSTCADSDRCAAMRIEVLIYAAMLPKVAECYSKRRF